MNVSASARHIDVRARMYSATPGPLKIHPDAPNFMVENDAEIPGVTTPQLRNLWLLKDRWQLSDDRRGPRFHPI
jgi:hypothetical protein